VIIFVNTKSFAETLLRILRKAGYEVNIIFGDMTGEERDEYIQKFRDREINIVITTNILARGLDVPEVQFVINFDVPTMRVGGKIMPDPENYLHRIGRAGRFDTPGIALTIYDRDEDEQMLFEIFDKY
jgi:superfamily II DNA/RNA helicase